MVRDWNRRSKLGQVYNGRAELHLASPPQCGHSAGQKCLLLVVAQPSASGTSDFNDFVNAN